MPEEASVTRWRDEKIVPADYEDVVSLVKIARQVRNRIVEFDWIFSREDLEGLRLAVHAWGSGVVGRYKCFSARVLAAINDGLGEADSGYVLKVPRNSESVPCEASCAADGDSFRLRGYAPFDIIFGYGTAGVSQEGAGVRHLGPAARQTLEGAVEMLGWDLRRLQEPRYMAFRNTLVGLRPDYGSSVGAGPADVPVVDFPIHFQGPFSAVDDGGCRCLFSDEISKQSGVYVWTIAVGDQTRPWYVGQTRVGFGTRTAQHLAGMLSGQYTTYDVNALMRGEYKRATGAIVGNWPETLPSVLRNYETLMPNILGLIRLMKFHLAVLDGDAHFYNRVEGAVVRHYKSHDDRQLRVLLQGVKVPAAIPFDKPIRFVLSSDIPIAGLPAEIRE